MNYNDYINNIKYSIFEDEDRIEIKVTYGNEKVGVLVFRITNYDIYEYEFSDVFSEKRFYELFSENEPLVIVEYLQIEDRFKRSGMGKKLMLFGIQHMKNEGYSQFYLSASPIGFHGLQTKELTSFYEKIGFEVILDQGHNVLMKMN